MEADTGSIKNNRKDNSAFRDSWSAFYLRSCLIIIKSKFHPASDLPYQLCVNQSRYLHFGLGGGYICFRSSWKRIKSLSLETEGCKFITLEGCCEVQTPNFL